VSLDFDAIFDGAVGTGRRAKPLSATVLRELRPEDIASLSEERGIKPTLLKKIGHRHHQIARLLASGTPTPDICLITGSDQSTLSILKNDPLFQEILSHYQNVAEKAYADMHERLASLGFDSVAELHRRLEEEPDSFDNKTLLSMVEVVADRTGHGKTQTINQNVAVLTGADIERIRSGSASDVRSVTQEDRRALLSLALSATGEHSDPPLEERIEGEGTLVREETSPAPEEARSARIIPLASVDRVPRQ
jgi:hypothetical protein